MFRKNTKECNSRLVNNCHELKMTGSNLLNENIRHKNRYPENVSNKIRFYLI